MSTSAQKLAVLCADITGGNELQAAISASEADHAIRRCEKRILQTVEGFKGRLVKHAANRLVVYFSETNDALQSAVDMQRRVAALPPLSGISLGVRVGVCVGHSSNEERFFSDDDTNPAALMSQAARPGELLLSVPSRSTTLHWPDLVAHERPDVAVRCGNRKLGVFQVDWRRSDNGELLVAEPAEARRPRQLALHCEDKTILLTHERELIRIGRQPKIDLRITADRASREHARIERRHEDFVLVDCSTNGTYVTFVGGTEKLVHNHELTLAGDGIFYCGEPAGRATQPPVRFFIEEI